VAVHFYTPVVGPCGLPAWMHFFTPLYMMIPPCLACTTLAHNTSGLIPRPWQAPNKRFAPQQKLETARACASGIYTHSENDLLRLIIEIDFVQGMVQNSPKCHNHPKLTTPEILRFPSNGSNHVRSSRSIPYASCKSCVLQF
jgi:hypothetical protein